MAVIAQFLLKQLYIFEFVFLEDCPTLYAYV